MLFLVHTLIAKTMTPSALMALVPNALHQSALPWPWEWTGCAHKAWLEEEQREAGEKGPRARLAQADQGASASSESGAQLPGQTRAVSWRSSRPSEHAQQGDFHPGVTGCL